MRTPTRKDRLPIGRVVEDLYEIVSSKAQQGRVGSGRAAHTQSFTKSRRDLLCSRSYITNPEIIQAKNRQSRRNATLRNRWHRQISLDYLNVTCLLRYVITYQ